MWKKTVAVILAAGLLLVLAPASSVKATGNLWYDKYVDLENAIGGDTYTSPYSNVLAWGESYVLRSYLVLYELTGNTDWLDKFVSHADTMLDNSNDDDGDGYLGWDTFAYSPVEVDNDGFELASGSDSTLPAGWKRFQSSSSTAYRAAGAAYEGNYGVVIKTNGMTWQKLYQPMKDYEPHSKYVLRVYAKTNGSPAKGHAYVHDRTTNTILASILIDDTEWNYYQAEFMTPAAGHQLEVWLGHGNYTYTGGEAYFDQVRVSGSFPYLVHDGMIGVPIAEFIRLVHQTPSLQAAYQAKADHYRDFIEEEIVPRWEHSSYLGNTWKNLSATEGIYTEPPNLATLVHGDEGKHLPYNMTLAFGHMLKIMYDVNGNSAYLDKAVKMHTYFRNNLAPNGNAYTWNYSDRPGSPPEDTSHGHVDMASVFEMYRSGLVYSGDDMWKFTHTLIDHMWNGSKTNPTVGRYVNGLSPGQLQYTRILCNWLELAQFHIDVWGIAAEQFRHYTPDNTVDLLTLAHIMKWDPQKLVNQDFELATWFDATQPARWVRWQSTSATAYLDSANRYSGDFGVTIVANGTTWQKLYQTWSDWRPSTAYTLTFHGKTDGSGAGGELIVYNETTKTVIASQAFSNTSWQSFTLNFVTPASSSDQIRIYLGNQNYTVSGGKAHFDRVVIKRTGDPF